MALPTYLEKVASQDWSIFLTKLYLPWGGGAHCARADFNELLLLNG